MSIFKNEIFNTVSIVKKLVASNDKVVLVPFIVITCWIVNYLMVQGYGLYYDDWPAIADHTKLKLWNNVDSPFGWLEVWPHGRPLGWFFLSLLGMPGRMTGELVNLYLVGFVLLSFIAVIIYFIVDRRFGRVAAILSAFLFLTSPVDTTKLEVTLNYIAHTGLLFSVLAIWLYQRNKISHAYIVSSLALVCYESTFFPFVAAPLLTWSLFSIETWKKQIFHGIICVLIIAGVSAIRYWGFDSDFAVHKSQQSRDAIEVFFLGLYNYSAHFFDFFRFGIKQGLVNISLLSMTIGLVISISLVYVIYQSKTYKRGYELEKIAELFIVGFILLLLGLVTSGFADYYPGLPWGGRNTRVYVAATFGGALTIISIFYLILFLGEKYKILSLSFLIVFISLFGVTSNAFKIQNDYVEAWDIQKQVFRSAIDLSCDAQPGDTILLIPKEPKWDKGRAMHPYGFGFSTAIADIFDWGDMHFKQIPNLMKAHKDWYEHLELKDNGMLYWKKLKLSGFGALAMAPVEPGSIILVKGTKRGLFRDNTPIVIDGVNVIKAAPNDKAVESCIFREKALNGPLAPFLYPDILAY